MPNKTLNILQWSLGSLMLLAITLFTYLSFQQNPVATIFAIITILMMVILKLRRLENFHLTNPAPQRFPVVIASYLSEIITITVVFVVAAYEIYQQGEVGLWFYAVLGSLLIARPLFSWLLEK